MTNKGNEVIEEVLNARKRYLAGVLSKVAPEDRQALVHNLHKIYELMKVEEV